MTSRLAAMVVLVCALSAAAGWCESVASPQQRMDNKFYAMLGRFEPTGGGYEGHTAISLVYSWANAMGYATVQYTASDHQLAGASGSVGVGDQAYTAIAGARQWLGKWYAGGGIGISTVRTDISTPLGSTASSETHFAWEALVGAPFGGRGLVELKYTDSGAESVRGLAVLVGVTY